MREKWSQQRAQGAQRRALLPGDWGKPHRKGTTGVKNWKPWNALGKGGWARLHQYLFYHYYLLFHARHCGKSEILILNICPSLSLKNSLYVPIPPSKTLLKYHSLSEASVSLLPPHSLKKYVSLYLPWAPEVFRQSLLGHSSLYYHIARVWFPYKAMAL